MHRDAEGRIAGRVIGPPASARIAHRLGPAMMQDEETDTGTPAARAGPEPARQPIDAASRARIGRELQRHYAQVLALPIPDHLRTLLDDLAEGVERESSR